MGLDKFLTINMARNGLYFDKTAKVIKCFLCSLEITSIKNFTNQHDLSCQMIVIKNKIYKDKSKRLESFKTAPKFHGYTFEEIANLGFFYGGIENNITCFSCNLTLTNVKCKILTAHIKYSPNCTFLTNINQQLYVSEIKSLPYSKSLIQIETLEKMIFNLTICQICFDNDKSVVFFPCKHLLCCELCGTKQRNCPICNKNIRATVKIFNC